MTQVLTTMFSFSCQGDLGGTSLDFSGLKSPSLSCHHFLFGLVHVPLVSYVAVGDAQLQISEITRERQSLNSNRIFCHGIFIKWCKTIQSIGYFQRGYFKEYRGSYPMHLIAGVDSRYLSFITQV